jgi:hypothetical protein
VWRRLDPMTKSASGNVLRCLAWACALALPATAPASETQPAVCVGIVIVAEGEVTIERAGESRPVAEGSVLLGGDVLNVRAGARCSAYGPTGEIIRLEGPAEFRVPEASEWDLLGEVAAWIRRQVGEWVGSPRRRAIVVRKLPRPWDVQCDTPPQLIPAPGGRVRPGDAQLYWGTIPGINEYLVTIMPEAGPETTHVIEGNHLELEELVGGEQYVWDVVPFLDGWTADELPQSFTAMSPADEALLERATENLDDLEAGVLLICTGLHREGIGRLDASVEAGRNDRSARFWRALALAEIGLYRQAHEDLEAIIHEP